MFVVERFGMPEGQVLEFSGLTKRFGAVTAVDGFTARVEPGVVTGFLGPNGAGKTTTLRMLLGLVRPTSGSATIGGVPYARLPQPLTTVGAALEASSYHPGRSAANHLTVYAHAAGLPTSRVDEALGLVGLADVAGRKVGGYSLGMRQRLGLAFTLLGDPGVLVLDEPANGLDPEGIKWMRGLLRQLARQGRTVLVSSHLLAEVQQTVDALLIVSQGRLVFQGSLGELAADDEQTVVADAADRAALGDALRAAGIEFDVLRAGLTVRGADTAAVGAAALAGGVALTALHKRGPALEEIFLDLVNGVRVHASAQDAPAAVEELDEAAVADDAPVADNATTADDAPAADEADAPVGAVVADDAPVADDPTTADDAPAADDAGADDTGEHIGADEDDAGALAVDEDRAHAGEAAESEETHTDADPEASGDRSFAVASTGVIDVVSASDTDASPSEQVAPAEGEAAADVEPDTSDGDEHSPWGDAQHPWGDDEVPWTEHDEGDQR